MNTENARVALAILVVLTLSTVAIEALKYLHRRARSVFIGVLLLLTLILASNVLNDFLEAYQ